MRKKKDSLSVFTKALNESGFTNPEETNEAIDVTNVLDGPDIDDLTDVEPVDEEEELDNTEDNSKPDPTPRDDDSPIPDSILNNSIQTKDIDELNDDEQQEEDIVTKEESEQVGAFFDAFAESLGWDVSDDERPTSVEGIIDYIQAVVELNSTPEYADERVAQLDAYVKNGGRFEDFYSNMQQNLEYDSLDMEDESNQKAVVRDYLKLTGYSDEQINKKIDRYEDADMLEDEAADAVERLKLIRQQQLLQMQQLQEAYRAQQEQASRLFVMDLNNSINNLTNIRGVAVPKEDRRALLDYITKIDADGMTQYQKDFNSNMVNNLIESAYFTMKGDALLGEAKRGGQTSAANKLRNMLKHQTKDHSKFVATDDNQRSLLDIASGTWR